MLFRSLVGIAVGIAMFVGMLLSWAVLVPYFASAAFDGGLAAAGGDLAKYVGTVFREKVRYIGAGTIGVAALWTLLKLVRPIVSGLQSALAPTARARRRATPASP